MNLKKNITDRSTDVTVRIQKLTCKSAKIGQRTNDLTKKLKD